MRGVNLYELGEAYRDIRSSLDDENPDTTVQAIFDTIEDAIENKVEAAIKLALESEATAAAIKAEEQRLSEKRKVQENRVQRLREYVRDAMVIAGIRQVKRPIFSVTLNAAKPSVVIDTIELIPKQFIVETIEVRPDKNALKKALLEEKANIPGCHIEQGKPSITVR